MPSFIESLESRTFLSVSPTVSTLAADARTVLSDLKSLGSVGTANLKLIATDIKLAGEQKSSKQLAATLVSQGKQAFTQLSHAITHTGSLIESDVKHLEADATKLSKHPGAVATALVALATAKLSANAATQLTAVADAITHEHDTNSTNLTAIETADASNTQLATDIANTIAPNSDTARTALSDALTTSLTTDITAIVAALAG